MRRAHAMFAALACVAAIAMTRGVTTSPPVEPRIAIASGALVEFPTWADPDPVTTTTTEAPPVTTTLAPQRQTPAPSAPAPGRCGDDFECFKACTLPIESGGDYTIIDRSGQHFGAFQFQIPTWQGAVTRAGYPEWAERLPSDAPAVVQDAAARQLWSERGTAPWGGRCS